MNHLQAYVNSLWIIQKIKMINFFNIKIILLLKLMNYLHWMQILSNMSELLIRNFMNSRIIVMDLKMTKLKICLGLTRIGLC